MTIDTALPILAKTALLVAMLLLAWPAIAAYSALFNRLWNDQTTRNISVMEAKWKFAPMDVVSTAETQADPPTDEPTTQLHDYVTTGGSQALKNRAFTHGVVWCVENDLTRAEAIKRLFGYDSDIGGAYTEAGTTIDNMITVLKSRHKIAADWSWPVPINRSGKVGKVKMQERRAA